jgi:hypothetical protein
MAAKACICNVLCKSSHYCARVMMEGIKVLLWWLLKKCGNKRSQPHPCKAVQKLNHELCEEKGESVVNGQRKSPRSISDLAHCFAMFCRSLKTQITDGPMPWRRHGKKKPFPYWHVVYEFDQPFGPYVEACNGFYEFPGTKNLANH